RPVRPNAATANAARLDAAIAVRDADALPILTADVCEVVDHTTGVTYDRQGSLTTWRTLLSARDPTWRQEPLATLGDSLALFRLWMSASGFAGARFDVGAYEREGIALLEVDAQGRRARTEVFAVDRLDDAATRSEEVLGLHSDAFVVRATHTGTAHAGGGAYERPFVVLNAFGPDGLTRVEFFDAEREDEALARFDELTAEPAAARFPAERHERRVRSNAATAHAARLDAAIAARDFDALPTLLADEYEVVEHTTGVTYDRQGQLSSYRALRSAQDPTHLFEPLATLGDSLALGRLSTSASGFVGRKFDVGAHERVVIDLVEVDAQERCRRVEVFATERLGDAVAQLYERYAEILPDGPARARAAATARSVATMTFGRLDPDSLDADRDAEALARFEELTAEPAPTRPTAAPPRGAKKRQHRVRANAATASTPRFEAVFAARDADALPTLLADEYHVVDHTTGVTYDRQGELTSYRALMRARDPTLRTEPLATLGDSLSLSR